MPCAWSRVWLLRFFPLALYFAGSVTLSQKRRAAEATVSQQAGTYGVMLTCPCMYHLMAFPFQSSTRQGAARNPRFAAAARDASTPNAWSCPALD
jgi:hypothetical protein